MKTFERKTYLLQNRLQLVWSQPPQAAPGGRMRRASARPPGAPLNFGFSGRQCSGPACGCEAVHGAPGAADLGPGGANGAAAQDAGAGCGSAAVAVSGPDLEVKLHYTPI